MSALGRILGEALDGLDNSAPSGTQATREGNSSPFGSLDVQTPVAPVRGKDAPLPAIQTPYRPRIRQVPHGGMATPSSGRSTPDSTPSRRGGAGEGMLGLGLGRAPGQAHQGVSRTPTPALDIPGLQAEIDVAHERAANAAVGTLKQIFPGTDDEVIEWVLEAEEGDLGRSIEKLLEMGGG